jgi:hypothetical protein
MIEIYLSLFLSVLNFILSIILIKVVKKIFKENIFNGYLLLSALKLGLILVLSLFLSNYLNVNNSTFFGFFVFFYFIFQILEILFLIKTKNT